MGDADQDLQELLLAPRESLGLELKQWLDPSTPEGRAKIAKGCIALRNNDGGRMLIGYKNDGTPDLGNEPQDVERTFHVDTIQAIVSKYSSAAFAIDVPLVNRDGQLYPVITVPSGVRTPVATKVALVHNGKELIKANAVYVRTLRSNNTVSTSEAHHGDWEALTRTCFNNREADIGGFVRRHLAALDLEALAALVPAFAGMLHRPTDTERLHQELENGRGRFEEAVRNRRLRVPDIGFREAVATVEGDVPPQSLDVEFRTRLLRSAPDLSGWPPFLDFSYGGRHLEHPYVLHGGWQALVADLPPDPPIVGYHLDFWRIEPRGVFYHRRGLEDDLRVSQGVTLPRELDFVVQTSGVAEIISHCLSFARSMGCDEAKTSLAFCFRWSKLRGRVLSCWTDPRRLFLRGLHAPAQQDEYESPPILVPLETPPAGIAPHVENVMRGLFILFGGAQFSSNVFGNIVNDRVSR